MSDTVQVYIVAGLNPENHVIELAKFFSRDDAQKHLDTRLTAMSSKQALYREVGIIVREEPKNEQHPAHWEHIGYKPKGS